MSRFDADPSSWDSSTSKYVRGQVGPRPSQSSSGYASSVGQNEEGDLPDSGGSMPYDIGKVADQNRQSGGYLKPQPSVEKDTVIICNDCGLLKDANGYLILSNFSGPKKDQVYYKPTPPPRPGETDDNDVFSDTKRSPAQQTACGRHLCVTVICLCVLLLGSIGANIYLYLKYERVSEDNPPPKTLICPRNVSLQVGSTADISCSLQMPSSSQYGIIDIYLIDGYQNNRHTLISDKPIPDSGAITEISDEFNVSTVVQGDGVLIVNVAYRSVQCCLQGDLYINVSGHITVKIEVFVEVTLTCPANHQHTVNAVNTLSCTQCICGDPGTVQPPVWSWTYNHDNATNVTQPGRVASVQAFDAATGLVTYGLVFNKTACFDGGVYTLVLTEVGTNVVQRINFTLQIPGVIHGPLTMAKTVLLLTQAGINATTTLCISNNHAAFIVDHNVTFTFIGSEESLEILQAENTSVTENQRNGNLAVIPASQQNIVFDTVTDQNVQYRPRYDSGVLDIILYFDKVQCFHSGYYQIHVDGVLLYNLTVNVDDIQERTPTTIYEKGGQTGFVESYNITMECAARVGCTKRSYIIDTEFGSNTTYNHTLYDRNNDDIPDFFLATVTSTVLNISMGLNDTTFTCMVGGDATAQELTYKIYVLDATFCETRGVNCEYYFPYRTESTCAQWVSCLEDRPRVKLCGPNLFYEKKDECSGVCEYQCPWTI